VGKTAERIVHLILPVSFFIVRIVVEQGKCKRENIIKQIAVIWVHPLVISISPIEDTDVISERLPSPKYPIRAIGSTISFAGKPRINAIKITPSRPISFPNGSKNVDIRDKSVASPVFIFAKIQIISPAGAATFIARISRAIVFSLRLLIRTLQKFGRLKEGSSNI